MVDKENVYQYLTFTLEDETYGFNIQSIKEVLEVPEITRIPGNQPYMAGVINLRGNIIPLVDLRRKFQMVKTELTSNTSIIIVEVLFDNELIMLGILVDSVKKVLKLSETQLDPPPRVGMNIDARFIDHLGKSGQELIIILNSGNLFSREELNHIQPASEMNQDCEKNEKHTKEVAI